MSSGIVGDMPKEIASKVGALFRMFQRSGVRGAHDVGELIQDGIV
jgi:hypothetical protein